MVIQISHNMREKMAPKYFVFLFVLAVLPVLSACSASQEARQATAKRIAAPAFMMNRQINTGAFNIMAWERMHQRHAPAHVYIEGDGQAYITKTQRSLDPTPTNPVALHLAAMDKADNVAYLARPCQYEGNRVFGKEQMAWNGEGPCPARYWTTHRYSPKVLKSMNAALDNIKAQYDISEFHLIGYSGGAAVAALLAAEREDVASLRSVAGNLDHAAFTTLHEVTPMSASLNPVDEAATLRFVPQHHFIGGEDEVIPSAVFHSYAQALAPSACNEHSLITDAGHEYGWTEKWPELLKRPLGCVVRAAKEPPKRFSPPPQEFIDAGKGKIF